MCTVHCSSHLVRSVCLGGCLPRGCTPPLLWTDRDLWKHNLSVTNGNGVSLSEGVQKVIALADRQTDRHTQTDEQADAHGWKQFVSSAIKNCIQSQVHKNYLLLQTNCEALWEKLNLIQSIVKCWSHFSSKYIKFILQWKCRVLPFQWPNSCREVSNHTQYHTYSPRKLRGIFTFKSSGSVSRIVRDSLSGLVGNAITSTSMY